MPWVEEKRENKHYCFKPVYTGAKVMGIGSIWQCDECGKKYVYAGLKVSFDKTHVYTVWYKEEDWNFKKDHKKWGRWAV